MKNKKGFLLSILLVFFICGVTIPLFMTNHKKVKAETISDLTGTTWIINSNPSLTPRFALNQNNITFTSNNIEYTELYVGYIPELDPESDIWFYSNNTSYIQVYSQPNWLDQSYRTITITGGSGATNSTFIGWLINNATQQVAPTGTQITHKYWAPWGVIRMSDNQSVGDNDIQYTVLFNEQRRQYDETTQTGLIFKGMITTDNVPHSYIESINGPGINILYMGDNNNLNNAMWLEFTYGDYMDTNLYNFMDLWGLWFDDAESHAYIVGMNQGYAEGYEVGRAAGQADGVEYTGLITGIFNGLGNILSIQVFPNITIGLLIGLPLLLGVLVIILKILRG